MPQKQSESTAASRSPASSPLLRVLLTSVGNDRHRFEVHRADGSSESIELETRSCLLHDLVHFAVETEAGLQRAFYGLLASGVRYDALLHGMQPADAAELWQVEQVVGPLQTAWQKQLDPTAFVAALRGYDAAVGRESPAWLDDGFVVRVFERLRQLEGRWRATEFGTSMELRFAVPEAPPR